MTKLFSAKYLPNLGERLKAAEEVKKSNGINEIKEITAT